MPTTWIFFDCFNTLVDDFDPSGDETGMKPLGHIPVKHSIFEKEEQFHAAYVEWRKREWSGGQWHEVRLEDRLRGALMLGQKNGARVEMVVDELLHEFHRTYPPSLRMTPGAKNMLDHFGNRYKTGLISNFFMADYPEKVLERFGLASTFDFILDSAQLGSKKPGPAIYEKALDLAGLHATDTDKILFIGDNPVNDVLRPIEMGMDAIHFNRSDARPNARPTPEGVRSIGAWSEFSF